MNIEHLKILQLVKDNMFYKYFLVHLSHINDIENSRDNGQDKKVLDIVKNAGVLFEIKRLRRRCTSLIVHPDSSGLLLTLRYHVASIRNLKNQKQKFEIFTN